MNWKAIIALAVLLAAGVAWSLLSGPPSGPVTPPPSAARVFPGLTPGEIQSLHLVWRDGANAETAAEFTRAENGWAVKSGALTDGGDLAHIRKVVEAFVKLRQQRAVPAEDGGDYGFSPPAVELRATLKDGREVAVFIGKTAWQGNLRYLQVAGEAQVRIIADELYGHCRHPLSWFRDHLVMTIPPFEAKKINVTTPAGTIAVEGAGAEWVQTLPVEDTADHETVQDFLERLYVVAQARKFIDQVDDADRATYGLDTPFLDVTVTGEEGATCRVKYSEGSGEHGGVMVPTLYALREGRLFDCGPDHLERLKIGDLQYFRSTALTTVDHKQLNLLQVSAPGRPRWSVVREGHKWSIAEPRRTEVDGGLVRLLPDMVSELVANRFFDQATPADFAAFGVDATNGTLVKLADSTGRHDTMTIGRFVPNTKESLRYVRLGDTNRVRAMQSRRADFLTGVDRGWLYFLYKQLWDMRSIEATNLRIDVRTDAGVVHGDWAVTWDAGAAAFTAAPSSTAHAQERETKELGETLTSLSTLPARHWVIDGHGNLERYGLEPDGWRVKITVTLNRGEGVVMRELVLGDTVPWPSTSGAPMPEVYARTGTDQALAGNIIFTLKPTVLDGLRALVVK